MAEKEPYIADRPLHWNADKTKLLEEDDPEGRSVAYGKGAVVQDEHVEKFGLNKKKVEPSKPLAKAKK